MGDYKPSNNNYQNKNRPRRTNSETNQARNQHTNTENTQAKNEFCSMSSSYEFSNYLFGLNIFDLYKPEQLAALVKDPMGNNKVLRELSMILYGTNGTFTNVVDYMTALPTLSRVVIPHGESERKKKRNKELALSTLRTIKDDEFIRDALFKGMVDGIAFYYFETQEMPMDNKKFLTDYDVRSMTEINEANSANFNVAIIPLPVDYTEIVGIKNGNYILAFNVDYFNQQPGEPAERRIKKYPKEIRDAYHARKNGKEGGNWVVLDSTKTIVHKVRSKTEEKYGRPIVLAAIADILYSDFFKDTKRNVLNDINNRILYQTFPEGKDKGTSALTRQQQERQHNDVKNAVINKNNRGGISFFSVAAGTKINALDAANIDIFDEKNEADLDNKIALALGFAGNALSGTSSGSYSAQESNLQLVTSQVLQWVKQIQTELVKCINANIIKDPNNYIDIEYLPLTHLNKSAMVGFMKDLYLQGSGSLSMWIAATGISPDAYFAILDEEKENGIYEKYLPHQTSFTLSKNDSNTQTGRPVTDNPSDRTVASRSNNGNAMPSPSDNK